MKLDAASCSLSSWCGAVMDDETLITELTKVKGIGKPKL